MADPDSQRRAHFRLRYPTDARLLLSTDDAQYFVSEISEGGLRIVLQADDGLADCPERIMGLLEIANQSLALEGRVLRRDANEAILVLSEGIPLPLILDEQRRLLRLFPALFGRD